jgi:hypothetical protein
MKATQSFTITSQDDDASTPTSEAVAQNLRQIFDLRFSKPHLLQRQTRAAKIDTERN